LLKKGEAVTIVLRISTAADIWCRIVLPGESGLGYVPCKALRLTSIAAQLTETAVPNPPAPPVGVRTEPALSAARINSRALSNNDISEMFGAGLPAEVLIAKI